MNSKSLVRCGLLLVGIGLAGTVRAQVALFDVNADADGFTGWTATHSSGDGGQNGNFIAASSTGLDVNGDSWGLYANSSQTASLIYEFGGTLGVGQTVEIGVSLGSISPGGTVGFGLQNSSDTNRFESYYIGFNTDSWKIKDAGAQEDITGPSTTFANSSWSNNNFLTFQFTQLAGNNYSFSVNGTAITNTGLTLAASDISQIRIFNFNAGSGGGSNQFYNSLSVIPEPGSIVLMSIMGSAFATVALLRRRKKV
jgi:hypothetical protein